MLEFSHDESHALALISGVSEGLDDWRKPMNTIRAYMVRQVKEQIQAAGDGVTGGVARGEWWAPLAPQYTRKDGTPVPAGGGIAKVRGQGAVKGRKKANGQRYTPGSRLYGNLKAGSLLSVHHVARNEVEIGPRTPIARDLNAMRQFAFYWLPKDREAIESIAARWMRAQVREAKRKA